MKKVTIIGGGPAALMLAAHLDTDKYKVTLYDKKKSVGRKFLVAGEGGLNLTFNAPLDTFIANYYPTEFMSPIIHKFTNDEFINWLSKLDIPTFIGSSNRVFPEKGIKPIEVLTKIVNHIKNKKINFQLNTNWLGWDKNGHLSFEGIESVDSDITIFALGGASWKVTGSDGNWKDDFEKKLINTIPFKAVNCAFEVNWNKDFINTHEGKPLKNISLNYNNKSSKGELIVSKFGLEGNAIYALSQKLQQVLTTEKKTTIYLDLKPTMTVDQIKNKYQKSKRSKPTDILKKDLKIDSTALAILKQFSDKNTFSNPDLLAEIIKSIPINIISAAKIDEAISTIGGIDLNEIDENFQLKKIPSSYIIGEMLNWFAPTGGYLLQGCFSMGFALAEHLNKQEI